MVSEHKNHGRSGQGVEDALEVARELDDGPWHGGHARLGGGSGGGGGVEAVHDSDEGDGDVHGVFRRVAARES